MQGYQNQIGSHEFNQIKDKLLFEYDYIKAITQNREVKVAHGNAIEANLRKWLSEFLPKKYGVTSGYVIPYGYDYKYKLKHYDIIIYNKLESPIIWSEKNSDMSELGKYDAIPIKFVHAVYEVKSRLTKSTATDSINKLNELSKYSSQLDPNFTCGIIFIELLENDNNNLKILKELYEGIKIPGFIGGLVMRYENDKSITGLISILKKENSVEGNMYINNSNQKTIAKVIDDLNITTIEDGSIKLSEQNAGIILKKTDTNTWNYSMTYSSHYETEHYILSIMWSRTSFSEFCKHLLGSLNGISYESRNMYAYGDVFDSAKFIEAKCRPDVKNGEKPYLAVRKIGDIDIDKNNYVIRRSDEGEYIEVPILVENYHTKDIVFSYDDFESSRVVGYRQYAGFPINLCINDMKEYKDYSEYLDNEVISHKLRFVYSENADEKEFYSVVVNLQIGKNELHIDEL